MQQKARKVFHILLVIALLCLVLLGFTIFLFVKITTLTNKNNQQQKQISLFTNWTNALQRVNADAYRRSKEIKVIVEDVEILNQTKIEQATRLLSITNQTESFQNRYYNFSRETTLLREETQQNRNVLRLMTQRNTSTSKTGCPGVTFHLLRDYQKVDYIRYRGYIPTLKEGTVCAWIECVNDRKWQAYFGYAASGRPNQLVFFRNDTRFFFEKNGEILDFTIDRFLQEQQITNLEKFHFCAWFSIKRLLAAFYINQVKVFQQNLGRRGPILGGGLLILGNELDGDGGVETMEAHQTFNGNISDFMIWPRVLSDREITEVATKCNCPQDYAVAMTVDKAEMNGEAFYSVLQSCPP